MQVISFRGMGHARYQTTVLGPCMHDSHKY